MTLVPKWMLSLMGDSKPGRRALARDALALEVDALHAAVHADARRFADAMASRTGGAFLDLGAAEGARYRLPFDALRGGAWVTASTGAGKTRLAGRVAGDLVGASLGGLPVSVVCLDMKGGEDGLADLVLRAAAALGASLAPSARAALFSRIITLSFSNGPFLTPWQVLAPDPAVDPLTQAAALADILEAAVGRGLGARQEMSLSLLLAGAIDRGIGLIELQHALDDRSRAARLLASSRVPEARRFAPRLARETQASIDGLGQRLGLLARTATAKAMAAGGGRLDFAPCFEPGAVTVIDASGAGGPFGAVALASLTHAAFAEGRKVRGHTVLFADEVQSAAANPSNVRCLERILTQGRSFGLSLVSCHQSVAQLPAEIRSLLATNTTLRIIGTSGADDARLAGEYLPRTGRVPRPRLPGEPPPARPDFLSAAEEERQRVAELARLPRGRFLVADRREPFQARVVTVPAFDPPAWRDLPPDAADAVRRGRLGRPRAEFVERARRLEEQLLADTGEENNDGGDCEAPAPAVPRRRPRGAVTGAVAGAARPAAPLPGFPDLVTGRASRPRRGGLP